MWCPQFSVNGAAMGTDATAPYELLFTVPAGVSSVTFGRQARLRVPAK